MFTAFLKCAEISLSYFFFPCGEIFLFNLMKDLGTGSISQYTGIMLSKY
jgi:hypothetical protein